MRQAAAILVAGVLVGTLGCAGSEPPERPVRVPDVELISRWEAADALARAGLRWRYRFPRPRWAVPPWRFRTGGPVLSTVPPSGSTADDDLVYHQDPEPGQEVEAGAVVDVWALPCWQPPDPPEPVEGCRD